MSKKNLYWEDHQSIDQISTIIQNDGVVVGSSDTVFGLLANTTQAGFCGLNAIKKRTEKPYIILIDSIDKLKYFISGEPSKAVLKLLQFGWPGPLTVIFQAKPGTPDFLCSSDHKVALRIPKHTGLLRLAANFIGLFSTSANLTGEYLPSLLSELNPQIINKVELIVTDRYNLVNVKTNLPSTILDCSTDEIKLIRAGAYDIATLEKISGCKFE